ncbi:MAG: Xaa-Pro aminopeptidase, partial [Aliidongia sp.]|nr:Xaa-Pro aminopeptidase [Aliidongia sp.]
VADDPSPALVGQLNALKALIAADLPNGAGDHARRLAAVREGMGRLSIDAFLVPHADEFQNEYLPEQGERLAWLTGFTGSAGAAVVLKDKAAIFVDGRYTLQVQAQTDTALFEPHHLIDEPPEAWLARVLQPGQVLGYDAWLLTPSQVERLRAATLQAGAALRAVEWNPLDAAWSGRPAAPLAPVVPQPLAFAGKSSSDKRREIGEALVREKRDAAVITAADSLAWLLNIRGGDVAHTPLALGYALIDTEGRVDLFIDRRKLAPGLETHLGNQVAVQGVEEFARALDALAGKSVQIDPATGPSWIFDRLTQANARPIAATDPVMLPKALKNPVELAGMRSAHRRDGAAVTRFLHWLDGAAAGGELGEIASSDRLEAFRAEGEHFRDLSFPSISGAGPNGAIVHYRASAESERRLEPNSLYLIDSGAQYLDGTTDITRTVAVGTPSAEMKDRYTRVLKGHIALSRAIFPKGTTGTQLDILARHALWQVGLDYDHGTGHGVGCYLGVHEGPARIAKVPSVQALLPGMVLSNEPGYYKTGGYGIRIENLVVVTPVERAGAEREIYGFETLTFAPIDKRPIEIGLLDAGEIAWLDNYHAQVRAIVLPQLDDPAVRAWLERATEPLGE